MSRKSTFRSAFLAVFVLLNAEVFVVTEECNKSNCRGPIGIYEQLKCQPIYAKEGDCCVTRYNCTHLDNRPTNKCYANGHEYEIGEQLKDEDKNICDDCTCQMGDDNHARFSCAPVNCPKRNVRKGCYLKNIDNCCGEEVCPKNKENIIMCKDNDRFYDFGESFHPNQNLELLCQCMEGYKGENVAPFCRRYTCGIEIHHSLDIRRNCVPLFSKFESVRSSCSKNYICNTSNETVFDTLNEKSLTQKSKDTVIPSINEKSPSEKSETPKSEEKNEDMLCKLGDRRMHIGDSLVDYRPYCFKCVCELPPMLTCREQFEIKRNYKTGESTVTCDLSKPK